MNNLAFQIYGTKKATPFQSVWKTDNIALGGELANIAASSLPTDWSGTNLLTGGYTHNGSGSSELLFSIGSTAFQNYQIICTLSAGSTGSVVINLGNVSSAPLSNSSTTIMLTPTAGSGTLKITPVDFVGTVSLSVKQSSSAANQIQLPITSIPVGKSIWIDWGDNSYSNMNSTNIIANRTHTYTASGEYTVRILGDNFNFGFGPTSSLNDRLKIKSISSWGKLKLGTTSFNSCSNLTMSGITDIPDLTGVTSLSSTFNSCSKITTVGRMNEWNTSGVTNMTAVFNGSVLFNQCIGGWNVSNVTTFEGMFYNCGEFNNGDNSTPLNNWRFSTTSSVSLNYPFINCKKFNRYVGDWNTSNVTIMADVFNGCTVFNNGFNAGVGTGNQLNWDTSSCTTMAGMFISAPAFNSNISLFNVSKVTTFRQMFYGCNTFNNGFAYGDGVGNQLPWNIGGNVTGTINMEGIFSYAPAFNSNLGTGTIPWDVSKVTTFRQMFQSASRFNNGNEADITKSKINNWNIGGSVTSVNLTSMFASASVFNRDISSWSVSKATSTNGMFSYATAFNQPLANWERVLSPNTSTLANVTNMTAMFSFATAFNKNIGNWNVSNVSAFATGDVSGMFYNATNFNNEGSGDIGNWQLKTTGTISMQNMFRNTAFNQNINAWNTVAVNNMQSMFYDARVFNQPLNAWNVSNVTSMSTMFFNTPAFNQPLNNWNTSAVINMSNMFDSSSGLICGFNQDIGSWNVSNVTSFTRFMATKTLATFSSTNLDAIYNGWIVNGVKPNTSSPLSTNISFGTAKYSQAGKPGRDILLASPNNWIITDGGNETVLALDAGNPLSYPGTGTIWTDLSGNNNNGTLVNGPTFDPANGGSIVFDGISDYCELTLSNNQTNFDYISICSWVKVNLSGQGYVISAQFNGTSVPYHLNVGGNNSPTLLNGIGFIISGATTNWRNSGINTNIRGDGKWHYVVGTFDGTTLSYYIDGSLDASSLEGLGQTLPKSNTIPKIGSYTNDSGFFSGYISSIQIYKRALSATEVLANFNATKGRYGL
jgi:surface protein